METTVPFELADDLAVVGKDGKDGYCSLKDGAVVIEPQFASADCFEGGEIASVHIDGDHTGYINREGDPVISDKYSEVGVFYDGVATARDENGETGVIDSEGKTLIPFKYDEIYEYYDNGYAVALEQVSEENYRYIAIDHTGNEIFSSDHQIDMFGNLFGEYVNDEYYILYDLKGSKLTDEKFSEVTAMFEETAVLIYDMDGKAGLLDGDGNRLLPCQYSGIDDIYHDTETGRQLWEVRYGEDGYCKLINEKGEEIPTGKYKEIGQFSDTGLAPVLHDGKVGYIDLTGKEVVPCEYYPATWDSGEPEEGFVLQFSNLYAVRKDGEDHYAIMDKNGKVVTDYKYSFVGETTPESESAQKGMSVSGALVVKDDGEKYGVVGLDGREISPCGSFYAVAESFDNGLILVKRSKDELWCLMDQNGKIVTEPVFDRLFEYALPPEADTSRNKEHHELTESDKDSLLKQVAQTAMPKMYESLLPDEMFADANIYGTSEEGEAFVWLYIGEYVALKGKAYEATATSTDAILKYDFDGDDIILTDIEWSPDGEEYDDWLKERFPEECLEKQRSYQYCDEEGHDLLAIGLEDEIRDVMGVPVERENVLDIDTAKGTYEIYRPIETVIDEESDEVQFDSETLEKGRLADVMK